MPVQPKEDQTAHEPGSITDQVAQGSEDSTASDHDFRK